MMIRRLYPWQSNDAPSEIDFDPADGAPPPAVATPPNSGSAPSPDAPASAAAPVTKTYTATISNYTTEFTQFFAVGPTDYPEPWQVTVSGLQISISDPGGVTDAGSWNCTLTLLTGTPEGAPPPPPTDPNYVAFTASGSQVNISSVGFGAVGNVFTDGAMLTNDGGGVSFTGDLSSDQTQIVGTVSIGDPHIFPIDVPVTLTLGGSPPPSALFTTGNDTVDFTGLTSAQVQAINGAAQLYNAMGGSDTVVLPTSPDGTTYPLVPQSGAGAIASGIAWVPGTTFVVGSAADTSANIDSITAGVANDPTLGSYQIQINGAATANITLYDNSNAISNTITLGTGNDTVTLDGNGNTTVTAGSGVDTLNISGGANLVVSSGFVGSATIGANSTLEIQGSPIAIAALSGSANIEGAAPGTGPGNTIAFTGPGATLKIDGTTMPTQTITGFAPGDTITFSGLFSPIAFTVLKVNNVLAVYTTDGTEHDLKLDPTQKFSGGFGITGPAGGPRTSRYSQTMPRPEVLRRPLRAMPLTLILTIVFVTSKSLVLLVLLVI